MRIRAGVRTDVGQVRSRNEDSYLVRDPLFAVADGMGGHRGGAEASSLALEVLERLRLPQDHPMQSLVEEFRRANQEVLNRGESERSLQGMGTTMTALVVQGETAYLAHVGDSRAYLFRGGKLQQLTEDQTLVQRMVSEGRLSPDEALTHPQRSVLVNALGVEGELPVEELTLPLHPGDRILLCTDGLTGMVDTERIQEILESEPDPQRAGDLLVEEAIRAGGDDNVTVIVLDVDPSDGPSGRDGTAGAGSAGKTLTEGPDTGQSPVVGATGVATADRRAVPDRPPAGRRTVPDTMIGQIPGVVRAGGTTRTDLEPPTQVEKEPSDQGPARGRRRHMLTWVAVVVALVAVALIGAKVYIDRQWYVGVSNGKVAIYQGIPSSIGGFELSHVEQATDLPAGQALQLRTWSDLRDGITASSLSDAKQIVAQIRKDLSQSRTGGGGT